ncbi:MAG: hypothetical protein ABI696_13410 [Rubrivivax sp.]
MSTSLLPPLEFDLECLETEAVAAPTPRVRAPRRSRGAPRLSLQPVPIPRLAALRTGPDAPPAGCGWFDSSLDLRQGLEVREHQGVDGLSALGSELPLGWWLQWELDAVLPSIR